MLLLSSEVKVEHPYLMNQFDHHRLQQPGVALLHPVCVSLLSCQSRELPLFLSMVGCRADMAGSVAAHKGLLLAKQPKQD
jgi:hypothetical protein